MPTGIQSARRSTSSLPVGPANANNDLWSASCASGGSDRRMRHAECHRARLEPKHRVGNPESRKFVLLLGARRPMSQAAGMTTGGIEGRGVETGRFRCDDGRGRGQMRRIREVQRMQRLGLSRADRPAVRSHIRQGSRGSGSNWSQTNAAAKIREVEITRLGCDDGHSGKYFFRRAKGGSARCWHL